MRFFPSRLLAILLLGSVLLGLAAWLRGPEYDEGYTAFVTGAAPRPAWPAAPFRAGDMRAAFAPAPGPWAIAGNLRRTDVHPPLYFWFVWAWRRLWGSDLFVTRLLSVGFSLGALAAVVALARAAALPAIPALLITLGCFGFVETGIVARGFALAQCLSLWGLCVTLRAAAGTPRSAIGAGVLLGAASVTNYLAGFPAAAALLWLGGRAPRQAARLLLGLAPFLLGDFSFFWAQRASRIGQFAPFTWGGFLAALGHAAGGAILGGLPLYFSGWRRMALSAGLGLLLAVLLLLPLLRWRRIGRRSPRALLVLAALSTPLGLCLMGLAAHSLPVEIRYLTFALPPFALLLAGAIGSLPRPAPLLALLLLVQAAAITGLLTRPETMQPERAAARAAFRAVGERGLVLLPRGNDGVGIVTAFLTAAPSGLHILLVEPGSRPDLLRAEIGHWPCVTAARIAVDGASRATIALLDRLAPAMGKCVDACSARLLG
ncbi:MAG TPA: glycosyltransferase family 39 protein, partial [Acidisoma sp.]